MKVLSVTLNLICIITKTIVLDIVVSTVPCRDSCSVHTHINLIKLRQDK